jgi:glycosyltransferase involved in cell wall biosynthesis
MIYPDEKEPNTGHKKTTNTPLVSIVMGTYNGEKYLREQLESIYGQTYQNIEVIICDDSSTDGTVKILSEFSREFGLTYYVNKANLGLVRNYEKALSLAKGDYLALADQDDIWYPGKIELLLDNIGTYSLIHSSVHVIDGNGNPNGDEFVVSEYSRDHTNKTNFSDFLETAWVLGCTSLIEKSLLEKSLPFPEGVMFHDWWLTMAAIKLGRGIKYIHKPTIKYRQYGGNTAFKFYMDLSWHKKRFEFYKVLALRFNDNLSLEERAKLSAVSNQNAAQFILMGLQRNEDGPVKQFLQENSDLLTVPFIREIISSHRANIRREFGGIEGQTTRIDNTARDPTYQFILSLRSKLYSPISTWDRIISIFHRRVFRPLIYIPIKRIYHAIRSHAGH